MRSMNIMIDPAHRRIILLDETPSDGTEGIVNNTSPQAAIIDHTDPSFLKQEKYLAFAASTSVKDVRPESNVCTQIYIQIIISRVCHAR